MDDLHQGFEVSDIHSCKYYISKMQYARSINAMNAYMFAALHWLARASTVPRWKISSQGR
ncbi:hypothetical protein XF_1731 [Xylella fastidiosa 9a5c]|uniref:Uncharacterized protein n=1 Tax=Xylella fastidiosa (strain 9a5c) TaxID=160492 RepID=Q9PCP7_XYLFA|nr:hypothetical protein XF_1731 [Xylella fastidiosa 9a5c]